MYLLIEAIDTMLVYTRILIVYTFLLGFVSSNDGPSVIIVGAGPAGLAAATRLLENNFTNVKIFEAERRIGGRINSVKVGSSFVDFGATYCHGEKNNIVYEKVKNLNVLYSTSWLSSWYYGNTSLEQEFGSKLFNAQLELLHEAGGDGCKKQSVGDYCERQYNDSVVSHFKEDPEKVRIALKALDVMEAHVTSLEGSFSWKEPACYQDYEECEGDQGLAWKDTGYKLFLDILMKKYPDPKQQLPIDDKIFLDREVTQISYDTAPKNKKTIVRTSDNDTYECDHLIFTPSVGVLKHRRDELFQPALTEEKAKAIEAIGFDAVMKVVLYYSDVWWEDKKGFILLWDLEKLDQLRSEFPEGPTFDGRPWFTYIRLLVGDSYNGNILTAWLTGPIVPQVEEMDELALKNGIHHIFNKFFGHRIKVPQVDKLVRSHWYTNPHFRGSYSFQSLKTATKSDGKSSEEILAEPILNEEGKPVIQFAGEATNDRHFGTVHGATETGYREADRFLAMYKRKV